MMIDGEGGGDAGGAAVTILADVLTLFDAGVVFFLDFLGSGGLVASAVADRFNEGFPGLFAVPAAPVAEKKEENNVIVF